MTSRYNPERYSTNGPENLPREIQQVVSGEEFEFVQHVHSADAGVDTDLFVDSIGRVLVLQFFDGSLQADLILRPAEVAALGDLS